MQPSFFSLKASISPQWIIPRVCLPSTLEGGSNRRLGIAAGWCWTILTAAMQQIGCMESWVIFDLPCWFCLGQGMVRLMAYIVWFMTICSCFCVSEYHVLLYHWITHQSGELNEVSDPWSLTRTPEFLRGIHSKNQHVAASWWLGLNPKTLQWTSCVRFCVFKFNMSVCQLACKMHFASEAQ